MVRPWKAPSAATIRVRPVRRASLNAASLASAPELQKKTAEPAGARRMPEQPLGQRDLRRGGEEVGDVAERGELGGHASRPAAGGRGRASLAAMPPSRSR